MWHLRDSVRNARIVRTLSDYTTLLSDYIEANRGLANEKVPFGSVHTCVMFLGVGRSGTTLVGALLDAHPNVVIANQQNTLKYLYPFAFSRDQMFTLLVRNAAAQAHLGRPGGGGYSYAVPGQFQGRAEKIEVIGDKSKSAQSVEWLASRPDLLAKLQKTTQARIGLLHVIRNPYDTIARRSLRRRVPLDKISREYFALTRQLQGIFDRVESDRNLDARRISVHLEDLIRNPAAELAGLCGGLGVDPIPTYLEACAGIVREKPSLARNLTAWPSELIEEIRQNMISVSWLKRYSFESE